MENTIGNPAQWESHFHAHFECIIVLEGDIQLIAARCGWTNYSNFYRMYLKQFGTAPTDT